MRLLVIEHCITLSSCHAGKIDKAYWGWCADRYARETCRLPDISTSQVSVWQRVEVIASGHAESGSDVFRRSAHRAPTATLHLLAVLCGAFPVPSVSGSGETPVASVTGGT